MKTVAEQFLRLLPTLQHVARFPSCNLSAICKRDGTVQAEVEAVIKDVAGSVGNWDEEYLAKAAGELGIALPAYKPGGAVRPAPVAPPAAPAKAKPIAAEAEAGKERAQPVQLAGKKVKPRFAAVLRLLAQDPRLTPKAACAQLGVPQTSWSYFVRTRFGSTEIDRAKLVEQFREEASRSPANKPPVRAVAPRPSKPLQPGRIEVREVASPIPTNLDLLAQINGLLASYRIEVTAVRLVPGPAAA